MRCRLVSLLALLVMIPAAAAAQGGTVNPACSDPAFVGPTLQGGNACQIIYDMFGYGAQQYASAAAGGNQEIGRADAIGGFLSWRVGMQLTGATVDVPTPDGTVQLMIPKGSSAGRKLRLKGRGLPGKTPGDLYAVLAVVPPKADSDAARVAYEQFAKAFADFNPRAHPPG